MVIGLVVGTLAIQASLKGPGTVLLAAPMAIWTIPIFDCAMALLRRKLIGRSIYSADHGHLHHRLLDRLGTSRGVLACVAMACLVVASAALIGVFLKSDAVALITALAVVGVFVATGMFGRAETALLATRALRFGQSMLPRPQNGQPSHTQAAYRLQGSRSWDTLWQTLTEAGEKYALHRIDLDVNFAAERESYSAVWKNGGAESPEQVWRVAIPLISGGQPVGRLAIDGLMNGCSSSQHIESLLELLEEVNSRVDELVWKESRLRPTNTYTWSSARPNSPLSDTRNAQPTSNQARTTPQRKNLHEF
jgi:UDP-GlcNAc:undecaprenyl-phosphate GlcNAc-1-phosphate transferase